ncbi:ferredoxin [Streptomyces sp. WA6-1-16]|uniref:ferredoxin n=1 Tax=Streptomyces sp. WA6-1-16 TaxID=2879427 RepID=UPI001CE25A94|nr:ferredoxin [Streptomyces sp. WA6-1-16]UCA50584.1 ferredoxin [Streptomyces sp. WA6-1-16]
MQISIDHSVCIGSGQCVLTAPGRFTQDEDGYAQVLPREAGDATHQQVDQAALACPVQAITVAR